MDDLVAFLRARLDEDQRAALKSVEQASTNLAGADAALVGIWHVVDRPATGTFVATRDQWDRVTEVVPTYGGAHAAHIVRQDPARVLADIEAKRRLLTAVVSARHDYDHWHARPPADSEERAKVLAGMTARWSAWQFVLGQLAKPYVDHPGFREEWRQLV